MALWEIIFVSGFFCVLPFLIVFHKTINAYIEHFWRRIFRGPWTDAPTPFAAGSLWVYRSGYIEYVYDNGAKRLDCWLAERRGIFIWQCNGYEVTEQGGKASGSFSTPPMTRAKALAYVKALGHAVTYVDNHQKFIFYKTK